MKCLENPDLFVKQQVSCYQQVVGCVNKDFPKRSLFGSQLWFPARPGFPVYFLFLFNLL